MNKQPRYKVGQTRKYEDYPRCKQCGGEISYEKRRDGAMFCSRECWREARTGGPPIPCATCGRHLTKRYSAKGYYCSRKCIPVEERTILCDLCGARIPEAKTTQFYMARSKRHFCSKKCAIQFRIETGGMLRASQAGNSSQQRHKAEHGVIPGYEQRRKAAIENAVLAREGLARKRKMGH